MAEPWWRRLPQRVLEENQRLQKILASGIISRFSWKRQGTGELWLTAGLVLETSTQEVEVRFPSRYPGECPSVRPVPYGTRLSSHQFGGDGVLCLELGPDNWHSQFTAADLITSAHKLLVLESRNALEPTPIPSRHLQTLGMTVRSSLHRLVLTPELARAGDGVGSSLVPFDYVLVLEDAAVVYWVTHLPSGTGLSRLPPRISSAYRRTGQVVRISDLNASLPTDVGGFRQFLREQGVQGDHLNSLTGLVLLFKGTDLIARWVPDKTEDAIRQVITIPTSTEGADRLGRALADTKGATIAIVGAGSIGSKVATSLARTGVQVMTLVDGDVLLPDNVVRHDGDFTHVGLLKVEATAARIRDVASEPVTVSEFSHDLADASNPLVHALTTQALAQANVIVDATANSDAFNFLADLASEEQRPLVWGEVFAGGLGGYVGYAVPGLTPCPSCVRAAFLAFLAQWPAAPRGQSQQYAGLSEVGPVVATDADVAVIASALTSVVLRVLARDLEGWGAILLIALRRGWIFERAFETRSLSVRTDDFSCERCWKKPDEPDEEKLAAVESLFA